MFFKISQVAVLANWQPGKLKIACLLLIAWEVGLKADLQSSIIELCK